MLTGEFLIEKPYVIGDINGDGEINLLDLMQCLNHVAKKITLGGNAFLAADINKDGYVNLLDLMRLMKFLSKKTTIL